jgi:hypothetical protein
VHRPSPNFAAFSAKPSNIREVREAAQRALVYRRRRLFDRGQASVLLSQAAASSPRPAELSPDTPGPLLPVEQALRVRWSADTLSPIRRFKGFEKAVRANLPSDKGSVT